MDNTVLDLYNSSDDTHPMIVLTIIWIIQIIQFSIDYLESLEAVHTAPSSKVMVLSHVIPSGNDNLM